MAVEIYSILLRVLIFITLFKSAGIALFLVIFEERIDQRYKEISLEIRSISRRGAQICLVLLLLYQFEGGARMLGELSGSFNIDMQLLALQTSSGIAIIISCLAMILIISADKLSNPQRKIFNIIAIALAIFSFTVTGHSSIHPHRWLISLVLLLHLGGVMFWFGSLLPLRIATKHEQRFGASVAMQFSGIAIWIVPCIALAGISMAVSLLPNIAAIFQPYGLLLLTKATSFAVLMIFASVNKWRLVPALTMGQESAIKRFELTIVSEIIMISFVLAVTAVMTGFYSPEL